MPGYYKVFGSKGWLEVGSFGYEGLRLRANYSPGGKGTVAVVVDETNPERDPKQFERQADHFTECILQNKTPRTPGEEGLRDMQYMREIYRAAGVNAL
jgi:predicted dehydrogenase